VGVVMAVVRGSRIASHRLKPVLSILDKEPLLPADQLDLLQWASGYYQHPIGEVIASALPAPLRQGRPSRLTANFSQAPNASRLAPHLLPSAPPLNRAQRQALEAVNAAKGFQAFLLDGVTGSGKTEVYLCIIEQVIAAGRQALVLVPEIGLTPQLVERFTERFNSTVAVLHSGLTDQERLKAWLMARSGEAAVVLGTRSAVFTPMSRLGVIVVDEEHDLSYKQQEGFRYHARDVAVLRAQRLGIPIMLGSATPALESLYNAEQGRYRRLVLPERTAVAQHNEVTVVDRRRAPADGILSQPLLSLMREHLERGEQVLLFLNRRGYAPTLICDHCGWAAHCARCEVRMVLHQQRRLLRCHHCGAERAAEQQCPDCAGTALRPLGHGTERAEEILARHFPGAGLIRIDRDSTRRKGSLQDMLDGVHSGRSQILIGTQMLAKGHHFPNVTLAGVLDADQGLYGVDFHAGERMAQTIVQVAGRSGRSDKPGAVVIQTHHPDHPLLQTLLTRGYHAFATAALDERRLAGLPPYSVMALLRAEAVSRSAPETFLNQARAEAETLLTKGVQLFGPLPAPMEKRAGRYRAQLLLQSPRRAELQRLLQTWIPLLEKLKLARKVRWSVDVDPMEML
jgi:primosomal protein N' (replication factor Y)